jgi:hypothetical protein
MVTTDAVAAISPTPLLVWSRILLCCAALLFATAVVLALQSWRPHRSLRWAALAVVPLGLGIWACVLAERASFAYAQSIDAACRLNFMFCPRRDVAQVLAQDLSGIRTLLTRDVPDIQLQGVLVVAFTLTCLGVSLALPIRGRSLGASGQTDTPPSPPVS